MKTFSGESSIYIGREAGQEVMNAIRNAKTSVKIVSPYLSEFYVKELVKLHKMNRQITLITCDHISENSMYSDFKVSDLVVNRAVPEAEFDNKRKKGLRYSFILFVPSAVGLLSSMFVNALIYPSLVLSCISVLTGFYFFIIKSKDVEYDTIFRIKVFDSKSGKRPYSTELIHSKIYVIDEEVAFVGSANFTYSGFKTHYETMIKIKDKKAVHDISKEIEDLYNSKELRVKEIKEWLV